MTPARLRSPLVKANIGFSHNIKTRKLQNLSKAALPLPISRNGGVLRITKTLVHTQNSGSPGAAYPARRLPQLSLVSFDVKGAYNGVFDVRLL